MTPSSLAGPEHPTPTRRSHYRYFFYEKHRGAGTRDDARWLNEVTRLEEFTIFDDADYYDLEDEKGRYLYGVLRDAEGELRELGTWQQEVAEFPRPGEGVPWHGYPIWAVNEEAPPNRARQSNCPPKTVLDKMQRQGLINRRQRTRLLKGDPG